MLLRSEEKSSPGVYESLLVTALGRRGRRRVGSPSLPASAAVQLIIELCYGHLEHSGLIWSGCRHGLWPWHVPYWLVRDAHREKYAVLSEQRLDM